MKIHILDSQSSVANQFLSEIRDTKIQADRLRFRKNLERLGELMAYEFSKTLAPSSRTVTTPLGTSETQVPETDLVLVTVLRAGLPFYQGFLHIFDQAGSGFLGAYREEGVGNDFSIALNYAALPNLDNKQLVLIDPMLATGQSLVKAFKQCLNYGQPKAVHIMAVISSPEGIGHLEKSIEYPGSIWTWSRDSHLNAWSYIVPGLGDAGDLSFGAKE